MKEHLRDKMLNIATYGFSGTYLAMDFESIKSIVLFIGTLILLVLQIRLHILKIKEKKRDANKSKEL